MLVVDRHLFKVLNNNKIMYRCCKEMGYCSKNLYKSPIVKQKHTRGVDTVFTIPNHMLAILKAMEYLNTY